MHLDQKENILLQITIKVIDMKDGDLVRFRHNGNVLYAGLTQGEEEVGYLEAWYEFTVTYD